MECICVGIVLIAPATDFIVSNRSTQQLFRRDSVILLISCSVIIKCWLCWCGHETIAADEFMACFYVGIVLIAPATSLLSRILLNNHSKIMPMWWWCWCKHETTTVTVFIVSIVLWLELHHCYDYMRCNNQRIDNTILYWRLWFLLSWRRGRVHRRFWSSVMLANWIYVSGCKTCNGCGRGGHRLM